MPERSRRRWRWIGWCLMPLLLLVISVEIVARVGLGLGDPPLYLADDTVEYLVKPGRYERFGNELFYNQWSMRSPPISKRKDSDRELRVLVFGDSVINGGALTDQPNLATSLLQRDLERRLERPVFVGNVAAGSWGPGNMLAYAERHGFFEADVVLLVLSSHDAADVPTFEPRVGVAANMPESAPLLASSELLTRYRSRWLTWDLAAWDDDGGERVNENLPDETLAARRHDALASLRSLIQSAQASGALVMLALHLDLQEHQDEPREGNTLLRQAAEILGVEVIELGPAFRQDLLRGFRPYRDVIHPSDWGQKLLAHELLKPLQQALSVQADRARTSKLESNPP